MEWGRAASSSKAAFFCTSPCCASRRFLFLDGTSAIMNVVGCGEVYGGFGPTNDVNFVMRKKSVGCNWKSSGRTKLFFLPTFWRVAGLTALRLSELAPHRHC